MEVEMRKYCLIKHFKTVATYLVAVIILASCLFVTIQSAQADSFTITSDQNDNDPNNPKAVTDQQTLNGNEVGLIEEGGELNVTNAAAIEMSNVNNRMTNKGSIETMGSFSIGIESKGYNATINNTGTI
jgi:hypothetical protein|tara:strand:+ start:486 stop:872 length:387 start_codon:yes stop_codon:yes gene_type:complete